MCVLLFLTFLHCCVWRLTDDTTWFLEIYVNLFNACCVRTALLDFVPGGNKELNTLFIFIGTYNWEIITYPQYKSDWKRKWRRKKWWVYIKQKLFCYFWFSFFLLHIYHYYKSRYWRITFGTVKKVINIPWKNGKVYLKLFKIMQPWANIRRVYTSDTHLKSKEGLCASRRITLLNSGNDFPSQSQQ